MTRFALIVALLLTALSTVAASFSSRPDAARFINEANKKYQLPKTYLARYLDKVSLQNRVVSRVRKPTEAKPWNVYEKLFVTPKRIDEGVAFWQKNATTLNQAEKKYGVEAAIIVAILGVETNYGEVQGSFRVLDSLATLSFKYTARSKFFKRELAEFFVLCREQGISPDSVYGSYSGAIGQPQFMPSSYRYYAVDFSGDGKRDLRHNTKDAIGSVANYFKRHGWKKNAMVTEPAIVKGSRYRLLRKNPRKAQYSINRLKRYGVTRQGNQTPGLASLVTLHNQQSKEHWLAYKNFFVITRYNTSKQYAMAVYQLAQALAKKHQTLVQKSETGKKLVKSQAKEDTYLL